MATSRKRLIPLAAVVLAGCGALVALAKAAPAARRHLGPVGRPSSGSGRFVAKVPMNTAMPPAEVKPGSRKTPAAIPSADPKPGPGMAGAIKETVYEFLNDDVMTQAAALAFYTGLAIAPLLTIVVWTARVFLPQNNKYDVMKTFSDVMGAQAYGSLEQLLQPATQQASTGMNVAGLISIALVAFSASGVFGQVQSALNSIWHVQARPTNGVVGFVKKRTLSLGMLATILFLLMVSVVLSTTLQGLLKAGGDATGTTTLWSVLQNVLSVGVFTVMFALLFKFVPDVKIGWKPVWVGGLLSAVLFGLGKFGLSFYLGHSSYDSSYGAAVGSFVVLLVWVYYSAIIVLLGAEATEVYARRQGHELKPDDHAVRVIQTTEPA